MKVNESCRSERNQSRPHRDEQNKLLQEQRATQERQAIEQEKQQSMFSTRQSVERNQQARNLTSGPLLNEGLSQQAATPSGPDIQDIANMSASTFQANLRAAQGAQQAQMQQAAPALSMIQSGEVMRPDQQGNSVRQVQDRLSQLGIPSGTPGQYDEATKQAVVQLQSQTQIQVDGQFGPQSLNALKEAEMAPRPGYTAMQSSVQQGKVLRQGDAGAATVDLQRALSHSGFNTEATGQFGPSTEQALKNFQQANGIQPTGQVGATTLEALQRTAQAPASQLEFDVNPTALRKAKDSTLGRLAARRVKKNAHIYQAASEKTGVPPELIAAIHANESQFGTYRASTKGPESGFGLDPRYVKTDWGNEQLAKHGLGQWERGTGSDRSILQSAVIAAEHLKRNAGYAGVQVDSQMNQAELAAAVTSYIAGPGAAKKALARGSSWMFDPNDTNPHPRHPGGTSIGRNGETIRVAPSRKTGLLRWDSLLPIIRENLGTANPPSRMPQSPAAPASSVPADAPPLHTLPGLQVPSAPTPSIASPGQPTLSQNAPSPSRSGPFQQSTAPSFPSAAQSQPSMANSAPSSFPSNSQVGAPSGMPSIGGPSAAQSASPGAVQPSGPTQGMFGPNVPKGNAPSFLEVVGGFLMALGQFGRSVQQLQERMQQLGHMDPSQCNGYFNQEMEKIVQDFQRNLGLEPTGQFGANDMRGLKDAEMAQRPNFSALQNTMQHGGSLQRGSAGASVVDLQRALTQNGHGVQVTGQFGPTTEQTVKSFQQANGIQPTGQVDTATAERLQEAPRPEAVSPTQSTSGMNEAQKYDHYSRLIQSNGGQLKTGPGQKNVVSLRTETDADVNGGQGRYDDKTVMLWTDAQGRKHVREYQSNTEPSARYRGRMGVDANGDGRRDQGRLPAGYYEYKTGSSSTLGRVLRPIRPTQAERDTDHDGLFNDGASASAGYSMLFHAGGNNSTGSAGCQTMPPAEYNRFWNDLRADGSGGNIGYTLINL